MTLTESSPLSSFLSRAQLTHAALSTVCSFGRLDPKTCMIETFHNNSKVITKFYKCQNWLFERAFKLDFELNICTEHPAPARSWTSPRNIYFFNLLYRESKMTLYVKRDTTYEGCDLFFI